MTIKEVSKFLGLDTSRVRQLARAGELKGIKVGQRAWAFDRADVEAFAALDRPGPGRPRKDSNPDD